MNVLFLTNISGIGGGETSLLTTLTAFGPSAQLVCPEGRLADAARRHGIVVHSVRFPNVHLLAGFLPLFSLKTVFNLRGIVRRYGIRIIHAESQLAFYYGALVSLTTGVPLVVTYHGYWKLRSRLLKFLLGKVAKRLFPVSEFVKRELLAFMPELADKTVVVPLPISERILHVVPDQQGARGRLGLPRDKRIILQLARFQPIKGQMRMLEAYRILIERSGRNDLLLLFVGGVLEPADEETLSYRDAVVAAADDLVRRGLVCFTGHVDDPIPYLEACDVVVVPSDKETFGLAALEAVACGRMVVTCAKGAMIEHQQTINSGYVICGSEPLQLANAIDAALASLSVQETIPSKKGISIALYSPTARCKQMLGEYVKII